MGCQFDTLFGTQVNPLQAEPTHALRNLWLVPDALMAVKFIPDLWPGTGVKDQLNSLSCVNAAVFPLHSMKISTDAQN